MTLKQKLIIFIAIGLVVVAAVAAVAVWLVNSQKSTDELAASQPMFTFTGAADWTEGPGNDTSKVLFSKARADGTTACFTSIEYYEGLVDVEARIAEGEATLAWGGNTVTPLGTQEMSLRTLDGDKIYQLHQYKIDSSGMPIKGGHSIGYLQLNGGYIKIYANCDTADDLPSAIPALQAYEIIG